MNVAEGLGEAHRAREPAVPELGLPDPDPRRRVRLETAFAVALVLHIGGLVLVVEAPRFGRAARPVASLPPAGPTPIRVVFHPPAAAPAPERLPPPDAPRSDQDRRARSEIAPPVPAETRAPAAAGRAPIPVPAAAGSDTGGAGPLRPAAAVVPAEAPPAGLPAADPRVLPPRPENPGQPAGRGFGIAAVEAAIRGEGLARATSGVADTGPLDFDAKDFPWGPYARRIYEIVDRNWKSIMPLAARTPGVRGRCKVRFRIARDGKVSGIELAAASGREALDQAALASIEMSDPLPPLPEAYGRDEVGVTFSYYYNLPIEEER